MQNFSSVRLLLIFGFCFLFGTIQVCIEEYRGLNISDTFISFMIPIVYLFLIVPLEYALELYSKYEILDLLEEFKRECKE